jgi:protocatechuate 3,4-dioxygenase beta subunit
MRLFGLWILALCGVLLVSAAPLSATEFQCAPTAGDMMGPFYKPDAPLRSSVGKGYLLTGLVKSALDCAPIPGAQIEFWLTSPEGEYDDQYRATVIAADSGAYRFESNRPRDYGYRPPHIHLRVTAAGFEPLVTQHYPQEEATGSQFDLVLVPNER